MFDQTHYVPVLRWKKGEQRALSELRDEDKCLLTPLLEMPSQQVLAGKLSSATADEIANNWGNGRLFFDVDSLVTANGGPGAGINIQSAYSRARELGLSMVPVTGLSRDTQYQSHLRHVVATDGRGVCVRLMRSDLDRPSLGPDIDSLLSFFSLAPEMVDMLIDVKIFQPSSHNMTRFVERLPYTQRWRTLTLVSGAFPKDLTRYTVGQHLLAREDWKSWRDQVNTMLVRRPTYGDYTIVHPYLANPVPGMNISASIRYTSENDWVIMRGEGLRNDGGSGHAQYPANAELLTLRAEFCGGDFSAGDRYIYDIGTLKNKTGNPTTWVQAGINHHLTFVVRQISRLFCS